MYGTMAPVLFELLSPYISYLIEKDLTLNAPLLIYVNSTELFYQSDAKYEDVLEASNPDLPGPEMQKVSYFLAWITFSPQ